MTPNALVSIVIPYYNQQSYIAEAVQSAKQQTYRHLEIIVVDDGSPVAAEPHLSGLTGFKLLRTENRGCPSTRNYGFSHSSGEFLIFLDGDDRLHPEAVEAHLSQLSLNPAAGMSFGAVRLIDAKGRQTREPRVCRPRKDYFLMFLESNPISSPGAVMLRREALIAAGLFDEKLRNGIDDHDLYLRIARRWEVIRHEACVLDYRRHHSNVSINMEPMLSGVLELLDRLEESGTLSSLERRRLRYGRRRFIHAFRPKQTLAYRFQDALYKLRCLQDMPLRSLFRA